MKKLKIALLGIVALLVIIMLLPTKIQNPVEGCLSEIDTHIGAIVIKNSVIGKVGNTGNAAGKPHHLHYSISSIIPQGDWRWEPKQILFYINPIKELEK